MKLYNSLTRALEAFSSINPDQANIYSCGPTVYDNIHIGNLCSFTYADILRRTLISAGYTVRHVMNFTDVDDKTIARSREQYPDQEPLTALKDLTTIHKQTFLQDMNSIGNTPNDLEFISAVESMEGIRQLIAELYKDGFAYIAEDGVYFSIDVYRRSGKTYGQLVHLTEENTSAERIQNDEYDKESAHDFALWKTRKPGEPSWSFTLDGQEFDGRPGWHVECSVMSVSKLGKPFDIHTGGIDLKFPHHENEIAQSTAGGGAVYANTFMHNEHLLVSGKKMAKSANNFTVSLSVPIRFLLADTRGCPK